MKNKEKYFIVFLKTNNGDDMVMAREIHDSFTEALGTRYDDVNTSIFASTKELNDFANYMHVTLRGKLGKEESDARTYAAHFCEPWEDQFKLRKESYFSAKVETLFEKIKNFIDLL